MPSKISFRFKFLNSRSPPLLNIEWVYVLVNQMHTKIVDCCLHTAQTNTFCEHNGKKSTAILLAIGDVRMTFSSVVLVSITQQQQKKYSCKQQTQNHQRMDGGLRIRFYVLSLRNRIGGHNSAHNVRWVQCGIYLLFLLLITQKCHRSVLLVGCFFFFFFSYSNDDGRNGNIFSLSFISDCFDFFL